MMVSQSAEYALRAVLHLAQHATENPLRAESVAEALDVPRNYLGKVLHALAKAGVLTSLRGPAGGFTLALPAEELTLHAVIAPFDALPRKRACLLGQGSCDDAEPCAAHEQWKTVADQIASFFRETTVAALLASPEEAERLLRGRSADAAPAQVDGRSFMSAAGGAGRPAPAALPHPSADGGKDG